MQDETLAGVAACVSVEVLGFVRGSEGREAEGLRFAALQDSQPTNPTPAAAADSSEDTAPAPAGPWLAMFEQDLRTALLAELDVRFHPIEGLLAALRTR